MTAQRINKINRNAAAPRIMPMVQQIFHSKVIEMKELRLMACPFNQIRSKRWKSGICLSDKIVQLYLNSMPAYGFG